MGCGVPSGHEADAQNTVGSADTPGAIRLVADTLLTSAVSGRVGAPVRFRRYWLDDIHTGYGFSTDSDSWDLSLGPLVSPSREGLSELLYATLIDMNFDGYADLWVSTRLNQRTTGSDVWLYVPRDSLGLWYQDPQFGFRVQIRASDYRYDQSLSSLPNLAIDTTAQRLVAGIGNCGCAGACFYSEVYRWERGDLVMEQRRSQACLALEFEYEVWERRGGQLEKVVSRRDSVHERDTYDLEDQYAPDFDFVW